MSKEKNFKKRVFHKFVDNIMKDGKARSSGAIIERLKDEMRGRGSTGRRRTAHNLPVQRRLSYYLRINKEYIYLDKDTRDARWKKLVKQGEE